jgi:hypothetical protein
VNSTGRLSLRGLALLNKLPSDLRQIPVWIVETKFTHPVERDVQFRDDKAVCPHLFVKSVNVLRV